MQGSLGKVKLTQQIGGKEKKYYLARTNIIPTYLLFKQNYS